jgi:RimJ/RimL family protein N-acetyltransferase
LITRSAILDWGFNEFDLNEIYGGAHSKNFPSIYNFKRQGWSVKKIVKKHRIVDNIDIDVISFVMTKDKWRESRTS